MKTPLAIGSIGIAMALLFAGGCQSSDTGITPEVRDITESVYASITLQPDSMYRVHASVTGILEHNLVREGDNVSPGDALLQVSAHSPELQQENARLQMELVTSQYLGEASPLGELASRIRVAELTYRDDSVNYQRQQNLWNQGIGSRSALENRQLAYARSTQTLEQLRSEYHRLEDQLRTQMVQARNTYNATRSDAGQFRIRSQIVGKVYALYKEPGEVVLPNEPLAMVGSADTFVAEMLVDEVDIVQLREAQRVLIYLDAYPDQVHEGVVSKIYPEKDIRNQTFRVEARFTSPPDVLYPGMSGEANIIIQTRKDALTIPRSYLMGTDSVLTENGMRQIRLGLQTLDRVEVLSGLDAGTRILKPEP